MANADDIITLCNQALYLLGANPITALDQGTQEANLCNAFYAAERQNLLRGHLWNFAINRAILSEYNLLLNPLFELGSEPPESWILGNTANLDRHATAPYAGTYCLEINENTDDDPYAYQAVTVKEFEKYALEVYVKAGTEATYKVAVYDMTNSAYIDAGTEAEATASWAIYEATDFTIPKDCTSIQIRLFQIAASGAGTTLFYDNAKLTHADWGYTHAYELPGDCLRTLQMEDLSYEFKIERGLLFTDESTAEILYIADEETVATFDKSFYKALVDKLAWLMCWPLTHSATFTKQMQDNFEKSSSEARSTDGQEGTPPEFEANTWLDAR